jgi:hypothetical protein
MRLAFLRLTKLIASPSGGTIFDLTICAREKRGVHQASFLGTQTSVCSELLTLSLGPQKLHF